jgi:hypothetical protein
MNWYATAAFPTVLIVLDVGAAVMWLTHGDLRRGVYWIAAAVITASVTF